MKSVIAAVLLAIPAAASIGVAWAEPDPAVHAKYSAYSNGFNVLEMQASLALTPRSYALEINYHTTGLVGALIHVRGDTRVEGGFGTNRPLPRTLFSTGYIRGALHVTQLEWKSGHPSIVQMTPPIADDDRDPVPEADQAGTVDSLSAIAQLMHEVGATGRCDGTLNTFDGRRLADLSTQTAGVENLPPTGRSSFHGPALRCDFTGHQLGGFTHDVDRAELQKPQRGTAWFASVRPGEPPIPVRFVFETRSFGPATAYLTE